MPTPSDIRASSWASLTKRAHDMSNGNAAHSSIIIATKENNKLNNARKLHEQYKPPMMCAFFHMLKNPAQLHALHSTWPHSSAKPLAVL